jgi:hypothetical protein
MGAVGRMSRFFASSALLLSLLLLGGCGRAGAVANARGGVTMPHPGGCYVLVFEEPRFMGERELIKGPAKHATLTDLPFGAHGVGESAARRLGSVRA